MYYVVRTGLRLDGPGTEAFDNYKDATTYAIGRKTYWEERGEKFEWEIYEVNNLWSTKGLNASRNFKVKAN
jgi:hypothetical protein